MQSPTQDPRVTKGIAFAETVWWCLAKRILAIAGQHYGWTEEQERAAWELFLRPNDYRVVAT